MNGFYWYIFITLIVEIVVILILSNKLKHKLPSMAGMVLSMTYAMTISLIVGIAFGILYQGDLLASTLVSILTGVIAGVLVGIRLGLLSSIEGAMSGLMGGMMGAMLGEMVTVKDASFLLILLLTFSICSLILFLVLSKEDSSNDVIGRWWYIKPLIVVTGIGTYMVFGFNLSQNTGAPQTSQQHQHHTSENAVTKDILVKAEKNRYLPSTFTVTVGEEVTLKFDNMDEIEHDLEIKVMPLRKTSSSIHNHNESEVSLHLHALPMTKNEVNFTPLEEGEYEFYCTIPGHKEAGMKGKVIVTKK